LVKEFRLANISDMAAGNAFLPGFMECFKESLALLPARAENLHRRLKVQASRLVDILCHRELRHVSQQLSLAYERKQIILSWANWLRSSPASRLRSTISPVGRSRCVGRDTPLPMVGHAGPIWLESSAHYKASGIAIKKTYCR
jgi:hypothetical protein